MKRTPLKKSSKPLNKVSPKRDLNEEKVIKQKQREDDLDFYTSIRKTRGNHCELSGVSLPDEIMSINYHHILRKESFKNLRHTDWNIVQVSAKIHSQIETNEFLLTKEQFDKLQLLKNIALYKLKNHLDN